MAKGIFKGYVTGFTYKGKPIKVAVFGTKKGYEATETGYPIIKVSKVKPVKVSKHKRKGRSVRKHNRRKPRRR